MAGRFVSVLGVVVWCGFRAAVGRVLASARTGRAPEVGSTAAAGRVTPMAVLVQPEPDPAAAAAAVVCWIWTVRVEGNGTTER
jgi:hypothetical protein